MITINIALFIGSMRLIIIYPSRHKTFRWKAHTTQHMQCISIMINHYAQNKHVKQLQGRGQDRTCAYINRHTFGLIDPGLHEIAQLYTRTLHHTPVEPISTSVTLSFFGADSVK